MPIKKYERRWVQKRQTIMMFVLFGGIALLELFPGSLVKRTDARPPIFVYMSIALGLAHYWILWTPHTITVFENGEVEFAGFLRRKRMMLNSIQSISPASRPQLLDVKADGAGFAIFHQFDDLHDFITRVKAANPNADIKGC